MGKRSVLKDDLEGMLASGDMEGIVSKAGHERGVIRTLIGMTYDKSRASSWRAMDAIGRITANEKPEKVRNTLERLLWMMREESGTNPWSAVEIVGEILTRNHEPYKDIIPIVINFAEEPIMRAGGMRAMYRIGTIRPELVREFAPLAIRYSADADAQVRGYAALALSVLDAPQMNDAFLRLRADHAAFLFYEDGTLREITVSEAASLAGGGG